MVHVRSSLTGLRSYVPGRKVPGAAVLASNESPYGLLPGVAARLAELAGGLARYPDMGAGRLVDALDLFGDRPNVAVVRTFSKAYALAGLRVGYCVGPADVIAQARKTQIPFSVTALAQEAAVAALLDQPEVARRCALTVAERERVTRELRTLGYGLPDSQANFVWLPLGQDSTAFAAHCLDKGVVVRAFPGEGVRVTIGLPEENSAFLALAEAWASAPTSRK
jgi:histidinol-phosphate/aromatic aminotransferase/cobyric acid decarboxylase-like protein